MQQKSQSGTLYDSRRFVIQSSLTDETNTSRHWNCDALVDALHRAQRTVASGCLGVVGLGARFSLSVLQPSGQGDMEQLLDADSVRRGTRRRAREHSVASQHREKIMTGIKHVYEVRPRSDHRGSDLISDALPFGRLWYGEPNAISNAVGYAQHRSRSHNAAIRVYDDAGNVIETHEHAGDFREP